MASKATKQYPLIDIKASIREVLEALGDELIGIPLEELNRHLWSSSMRVEWGSLKEAIIEMERDEIIEQRPHPQRRNAKLIHLRELGQQQLPLFDFLTSRSEIERQERATQDLYTEDEAEREQASISVLQDIAAGHAQESIFAKYVRKVAANLANENPVELILEMAEWVVDDINSLADRIKKAGQNKQEEVRRLARELGFRRIKAVSFFCRLWRFDPPVGSIKGIMNLPTVPQMVSGQRASVDIVRARQRLQRRIIGQKVIDVLEPVENSHKAAIGTDASVGDIRVRHEQGSFIPPTPAVLFVASAAMRVRDSGVMSPYWDYDLNPRELEKYEDLDAAQQGLLISPRLRREAITDFRHLRSAAMELRQYMQELRVVRQEAQWHPISNSPDLKQPPPTSLIFRDGRIFPLVHRLDDYDGASAPDDVLYGEVVRREINAFREVFKSTTTTKLGAIYGGTVKAPEFSWFAMIAFWYMRVKKGIKELPDGFYRPPLNDQAVTHLLFWGLTEFNPEVFTSQRNMYVTFRAVRRYSDIAFQSAPQVLTNPDRSVKRIVDEDIEDDWIEYIEQHINDANDRYEKHKRGVPALSSVQEYEAFIDLCYRAGVMMFYSAPCRMYKAVIESSSHFLTPRWETIINLEKFDSDWNNQRMGRMLSWLIDEGGLVKDETHAVGGHEELVEGLPLYIPDVVMQAHEMVVYTQQRHVPDIEDRLHELVKDIRAGRLNLIRG